MIASTKRTDEIGSVMPPEEIYSTVSLKLYILLAIATPTIKDKKT
jgi:hypothetical protein